MNDNLKGYANTQLLITTEALSERLVAGSATPVLLDFRPAEVFAAGHIPGAVHLNLFGVSLIDTDPAPLSAFLWMIGHLLASRAVDPQRTVVVYDERSGMRAARAFWFLEYFGHSDVRQLDGGFGGWKREGRRVSRDAVSPKNSGWTVGRSDERLATWRQLRDRLDAADVAVLDTRSDGEYYGTTVRAKRGGAVPGAVHIEWTRNLGEDDAFRPAVALRQMHESAGVTPDKEVISYCRAATARRTATWSCGCSATRASARKEVRNGTGSPAIGGGCHTATRSDSLRATLKGLWGMPCQFRPGSTTSTSTTRSSTSRHSGIESLPRTT